MGLPQATLLLRDAAPDVRIVDIGAMDVGEGDATARLLKARKASVIGFEPVAEACARLNAGRADVRQTYLPYAIGDGGPTEFRECASAMTSSLYEPNTTLLEPFQALAELATVVKRTALQTTRLDDVAEAAEADFLKMDVQGAELDVLRGGARLLASLLVVQTEVAFVPIYRDQPLFADIDAELRRHGFMFHRFAGIGGRAFKPFVKNGDLAAPISQQLWGDAIYVRDLTRLDTLAPDRLLKLALIVNEAYISFDLAAFVLRTHDRMTGGRLGAGFTSAVVAAQPAKAAAGAA